MPIFRIIFVLLLLLPLSANDIDKHHKMVSEKVIEWSNILDEKINNWLDNEGNYSSKIDKVNILTNTKSKKVTTIDDFFRNKKYMDDTDETFFTVRFYNNFESKKSNKYTVKFDGQVPLTKSKKSLKFFIADIDKTDDKNENSEAKIGINYFAPDAYGIESKYSLGLTDTSLYVRARYYMLLNLDNWTIEPSQWFRYSDKYEFEEETNIYFDKYFNHQSLFRVHLHRKTQTTIDGMDYALRLQYYWGFMDNTGLRVSQSFIGNTKYSYAVDSSIEPFKTQIYSGVHEYITSFSFRQNIWRKWFFYEVRPGVSFHKDYDYNPNYMLRLYFDFHFGKY